MFTRRTATPSGRTRRSLTRTIAGFCTAALASAALVVLPSLSATADDATDALAVTATAARAEANTAADAATIAEGEAAAAAAAATDAQAAADGLAVLATEAADALALLPGDPVLQAAFDTAQGLADTAAADAATAALLATDASNAAIDARAVANNLGVIADEAEAALQAALDALGAVPPEEEVVDETQDAQKFILNPCDNKDLSSFTQETKGQWEWCMPKPDIDIYVKNLCPTEIFVKISKLIPWGDYDVYVNGVKRDVAQDHGKIEFTVTDFTHGKFEVKVKYGKDKWTDEHEYIKNDCPSGKAETEHECKVLNGDAEVEVKVWGLDKWREYDITITGPGGYDKDFDVKNSEWWNEDLDLKPGEYTVTIESDDYKKPHIGKVTFTFTVAPCPGEVVISITPVCAATSSGSLGAVLSGLVVGREYHVTVMGSNGVVTDTTFNATSTSWNVPPANLSPGTYTVTVVDTHSHAGYSKSMDDKKWPPREKEHLTWTATGTIASCPATATLPTLARTGGELSGIAYAGLLLLPLGGALMLARRRMVRQEAELERAE